MKGGVEDRKGVNSDNKERKRIITFKELRLYGQLAEAKERWDLKEVEKIRAELQKSLRGDN